jgi:hypothetical protein
MVSRASSGCNVTDPAPNSLARRQSGPPLAEDDHGSRFFSLELPGTSAGYGAGSAAVVTPAARRP